MMTEKPYAFRVLQRVTLGMVVVLGLLFIVATGGGGGSSSAPATAPAPLPTGVWDSSTWDNAAWGP